MSDDVPRDNRRRAFLAGLGSTVMLPLAARARADVEPRAVTPSDAEGPFYPTEFPEDVDNDLMRVVPQRRSGARPAPMPPFAPGQIAYVTGKVMDVDGDLIRGARVEIWQCDDGGVYHHPGDTTGDPDERFQGYGVTTSSWEGAYHFRTIRPVPYPGRTPHIHFRVTAPGFRSLTTQLYDADQAGRNGRDSLYTRHSPAERRLLTSHFEPLMPDASGPVAAVFDIVLASRG